MTTQSRLLAWRISPTEEPGLQAMESPRVGQSERLTLTDWHDRKQQLDIKPNSCLLLRLGLPSLTASPWNEWEMWFLKSGLDLSLVLTLSRCVSMSKLPKFKSLSLTYAYPFTGCSRKGETEYATSTLLLARGSQQRSAGASSDRLEGPVAPISSHHYILRLQVFAGTLLL